MNFERRLPRLIASVTAVAGLVLIAGCTSGTSPNAATPGTSEASIVTVPGGPSAYFADWETGIAAAGEEFSISRTTNMVPPSITFDVDTQNATIDSAASQGYNGFAVFPDDAKASNTEFKKLTSQGLSVISVAGCTDDPSTAMFCLATDVEQSAYEQMKYAIDKIGGAGNVAFMTSLLTDPNTKPRIAGAEKAVAETNGKVTLVQTVTGVDSPTDATPTAQNLLASKGDVLDAIVGASYYSGVGIASVMTDQPQYRHIITVMEDNDPALMEAVEKGYVTATMWQNPYGQAYLAGYTLNQVIAHGCTVSDTAAFTKTAQTEKFVNSGFQIIDQANVATYIDGPYSLPEKTAEVKDLIDSKILDCEK